MPRRSRPVIPHLLHHVTQRGNYQADIFLDDEDRRYFLELLSKYTNRAHVEIAGYCLMTNHTHLLLVPHDKEGLARALKPVHMRYSQWLNKRFTRTGLNWQGRFFSSPLDERHAWNAFKYVAENPKRAGLIDRIDLYPWSSAKDHLVGGTTSLLTASERWLKKGHLAVSASLHTCLSQDECQLLRRNTFMNIPVGSERFVLSLERRTGRSMKFRQRGRPPKA